jgi:hypothetical protein
MRALPVLAFTRATAAPQVGKAEAAMLVVKGKPDNVTKLSNPMVINSIPLLAS